MTQIIDYKVNVIPSTDEIIELYTSAGLKRPTDDYERIAKMYKNSNLVISAWCNDRLVGVARSVTDFCFCCYLSDLAVRLELQKQGIGLKLINTTKEYIGNKTMLLLLSAPEAMSYYPKIGMDVVSNGFMLKRDQ